MKYKFYQLPIGDIFTLPTAEGRNTFEQFKKISDTRAVSRLYPLEWGTSQYPFRKDAEVLPINTPTVSEWETFSIEITHEAGGDDNERMTVIERFESELYRLVAKYQGQAGLKFYASNSEGEIVEW